MTRLATLLVCLVFLGSLGLAQDPSTQTVPDSSMGQKSQAPGTAMGMHHMHDMSGMHGQMMKDMQADVDTLRSNLQKMKDQVGKVADRGTRDQLQLNIDMWQSLIDHMDNHVSQMKKMMDAHSESKHHLERPPATPKQ